MREPVRICKVARYQLRWQRLPPFKACPDCVGGSPGWNLELCRTKVRFGEWGKPFNAIIKKPSSTGRGYKNLAYLVLKAPSAWRSQKQNLSSSESGD